MVRLNMMLMIGDTPLPRKGPDQHKTTRHSGRHRNTPGPTEPITSTKTTDFLMRGPICRSSISHFLKSVSSKREDKRHLQILKNTLTVNTHTRKFKKSTTSNRYETSVLGRIREERDEVITETDLPVQTVGNITGCCLGQQDVVTTTTIHSVEHSRTV